MATKKEGSKGFLFKPKIVNRARKGKYNFVTEFPSMKEFADISNVSRATISKYSKEIVEMLLKDEPEKKKNFLLWCEFD